MKMAPTTLVKWLPAIALVLIVSISVGQCANSNNNGNLTLDNVPSDHVYQSSGEYDEGGFPLPTTWGLIDSFLNTISPASPPYELITGVISGQTAFSVSLLTGSISSLTGNLMGFAICFIIGALFVVIFPIVALCFCCCRCCGNCGGKMYQKEGNYDRIKRVVFGFLLALCMGFIVGGVATAFCVNTFTSQKVESLPQDVVDNIDDMVSFVTYTLQEINFTVVDQLNYTLTQVTQDLTAIDQLVGVPVKQELSSIVQPAIDAIYPLDNSISSTYNGLVNINTTQASVEDMWLEVKTRVDQAFTDLTSACASCTGSCCSAPSAPDFTGLNMNADWRDINLGMGHGSFPQTVVDSAIVSMADVNNADLSSAADEGASNFNNLPETLKNTTQSQIDAIVSTINGLSGSIFDLLSAATSQLAGIVGQVDGYRDTINSFTPFIQDYDPYRSYALIGFYSVLLVIAVLFLFGLILGVAGYNSDVSPAHRGNCSHCGGVFMMAAVGIAFIFLTFFMLFTMLLFIVGGPVDRLVCDPLVSGELFAETIDKKDALGPGYFLGQTLFQNGNISLTLTGILDDCEANKAVYEAFQLDSYLNISALLDFQQFIPDIGSQFTNVTGDLTDVDILTPSTRQILIDFRDSPADNINWTLFKEELAKDLTNDVNSADDLSVLAGLLNTFASTLSGGDVTTFQNLATTLSDIQTNYIAPLLTERDTLSTHITDLESVTSTIDSLVNATIAAADSAQAHLDSSGPTLIAQEVGDYENRILGYPDQFVTYAFNQLENEIGKCRPVYNLWTSLINSFCRGILESVNALWLIMGWCIFFLLPATIFGVKLAKHYRRMDRDDSSGNAHTSDGDMEMIVQDGHGSNHFSSNKVAPSYA
ncbi:prominin-1-A-like isoform X2 [Patiria miniata]|uniref:Prominin-1-A-like n=1 Tax=Patiria miniata TaxID=46514 RepID=A0A914B3F7_PATMI|nr:prominin-1-A-like isoform X2 [Patiria miniata]